MVGREPAEPMTPAEPTSSAGENTFSLVRRSTETGSSVIYGRCSSQPEIEITAIDMEDIISCSSCTGDIKDTEILP